jgi:hypothetical protein
LSIRPCHNRAACYSVPRPCGAAVYTGDSRHRDRAVVGGLAPVGRGDHAAANGKARFAHFEILHAMMVLLKIARFSSRALVRGSDVSRRVSADGWRVVPPGLGGEVSPAPATTAGRPKCLRHVTRWQLWPRPSPDRSAHLSDSTPLASMRPNSPRAASLLPLGTSRPRRRLGVRCCWPRSESPQAC